jgi:hypothetical protein
VTRAGQMIKYGQIDPTSGTAAGSLAVPRAPFWVPSSRGRPAQASRSFPPLKHFLPYRQQDLHCLHNNLREARAYFRVHLALVSNLHCTGWRKGAK